MKMSLHNRLHVDTEEWVQRVRDAINDEDAKSIGAQLIVLVHDVCAEYAKDRLIDLQAALDIIQKGEVRIVLSLDENPAARAREEGSKQE